MQTRTVGAKKGGRVHWLLFNLSADVKKCGYSLSYNYDTKDYCLMRRKKRTLRSIFIVSKTSKRAYRLMYHNLLTRKTFYTSFKSAKDTAEYINRFVRLEAIDEEAVIVRERTIANFIKNLKFLMRVRNVGQSELARAINVAQQTVSKYLRRQIAPPEIVIERIANFFELSYDDLIGNST